VNSDEDDINLLISELSSFEVPTKTREVVQQTTSLEEKDLQQYFLDKTKALIDTGLATVQDLAPAVTSSGDAKEMDALSKLMASTAQALDTLQKTALIDKKANRDEQLEHIKIKAKKEIAQLTKGPHQITNNNILVASREEIMKKLFSDQPEVLKIDNK
jgi:hypothetical protein